MPDCLRLRTVFSQRLPLVALALLVLATGCNSLLYTTEDADDK